VSPNRYHVEADSLDELNARVVEQYGADASVVSTTVVTSKGIQGFFAHRSFRATVEVSDGTSVDAHVFDLPARAGMAALLDSADEHEAAERFADPAWAVSTSSSGFASILAGLRHTTAPIAAESAKAAAVAAVGPIAAAATVPVSPVPSAPAPPVAAAAPLRAAGDLVLVVAPGAQSLAAAGTVAREGDCVLRTAGSLVRPGVERVEHRREATAARADGVRSGAAVVVAYGVEPDSMGDVPGLAGLREIAADQLWVAVDVRLKPEDTARWVRAVAAAAPVTGVLASGAAETASPRTVEQLGLPVRWLEAD
jgi:hypothetical protein